MEPSEAVAQAMTLIAPLAAGSINIAQGVAVRVLGDLVAGRLRQDGNESAWETFRQDPRNDSLVRYLLQNAMSNDAHFRNEFYGALNAALRESPRNSGQQSISITGPGHAQIGDRGDTITGSRVATRGSSYHEGDIVNEGDQVTHKKSNIGVLVFLGIAAAIIVIVLIVKGASLLAKQSHDGGLTAASSCQQFLNTDEQTEQQALVDIAMSKGIGGFGSPLALPEIRYECSGAPTMTLGAIIERDKNAF